MGTRAVVAAMAAISDMCHRRGTYRHPEMLNGKGGEFREYHKMRQAAFLKERLVKSINSFSDADKITLAEAGAECYHPRPASYDPDGFETRRWLEEILCVHHHGVCSACSAMEFCKTLSKWRSDESSR